MQEIDAKTWCAILHLTKGAHQRSRLFFLFYICGPIFTFVDCAYQILIYWSFFTVKTTVLFCRLIFWTIKDREEIHCPRSLLI